MSFEALKTEVTKMQMLCTNCHALKTFTADVNGTGILSTEKETVRLRERLDRLREPYSQQKMATGCEWPECEFVITLPAQLHHDHIDPATKKVDVGHMYNMKGFTPEFGNAEVAKCKVLCGNHHAVRTMLQMNGYCVWKSGFPSGDISEFVADVRTKRRAASEAAAIAAAAAAATAKAAKTDSDDNDDSDDDSDIDDE